MRASIRERALHASCALKCFFLVVSLCIIALGFGLLDSTGVHLGRPLTTIVSARNKALLERGVISGDGSGVATAVAGGDDEKPSNLLPIGLLLAVPALAASAGASKSESKSPSDLSAPILLSSGKPATASVRGNLGPATVVTSESTADWLTDRWQAAADMSGTPIPGEHWVEIDLEHIASLSRVVLDWETAHATAWTIRARLYEDSSWATLAVGTESSSVSSSLPQHVIQQVLLPPGARARYIKLLIHSPATRWGSSLWRFQVWGRDLRRKEV